MINFILNSRTIVCLVLTTVLFSSYSQHTENDSRKYIEVTGSAEMTILSDHIVLQVILVAKDKVGLDKAEKDFYHVLKDNHIAQESVQIESSLQYDWWYWWHNHDHTTKTVKIKLTNATNFMKLARDLHVQWVRSVEMISSTNSETQRLRKEVKIQAIKAAKEKATYMLESLGETIGAVLAVTEIPESIPTNYYWYGRNNQSLTSNSVMENSSINNNGIENGREIKLRYEVKVKFEIK